MARRWLDEQLAAISYADVEKVHKDDRKLQMAQKKFQSIADATENPMRVDKKTGRPTRASKDIKFLSSSIKFDKASGASDPMVKRTSTKGLYLTPAGKFGTADCCRHKTGPCGAACLHDTGFQDLANQIARTNALEQMGPDAVALLANEIDNHVRDSARYDRARGHHGSLPAVRLDATSELLMDEMDIGDFLIGRHSGIQQEGAFKGYPHLLVSEYGKGLAKGILPGPEPTWRQPNVVRVPSWSEQTTIGRAEQLRSRGIDIAVPATNYGTSTHPKDIPSHVSVQFKGGRMVLPAVDYDEHDVIAMRPFSGSAGILRAKNPAFSKRDPERQKKASKFLTDQHTPYEPGVGFEGGESPVSPVETFNIPMHDIVRRKMNGPQFWNSEE